MSITALYLSGNSFSVAGDLSSQLAIGVRVRANCGEDGFVYGTVATVSSTTVLTMVTLAMDDDPLTPNLTNILHGTDVPLSLCNHASQHTAGGRDPIAMATTSAAGLVEFATDAEAQGLESESVVLTPSNVAALLASEAEAEEGTAENRIMTPLGTRQAILATVPGDIGAVPSSRTISTTAPLGGGGDLTANKTLTVSAASTTATGVVELATSTEAVTGTDTSLVPPVSAHRQAFMSWMRDAVGEFPGLILPAYNLFAPNLALPGTTTFTRASSAWRLNAAGLVVPAAVNVPRFDYDAAGNLLGLRLEAAATRLNTIAAAPTAPENIGVTAQAYTISFYGTGSMALSGVHTATVVGTGAFPTRTSYTFTPTDGTLTLTPSGGVQHLQVEAGGCASTPILGEGSQVARAADVDSIALSSLDFNTAEGAVFIDATPVPYTTARGLFIFYDGTTSNRIMCYVTDSSSLLLSIIKNGVTTHATPGIAGKTNRFRLAASWKENDVRVFVDGLSVGSLTSIGIPTGLTTLRIGMLQSASSPWSGGIHHFAYFPRALTNAQLQAITL